MSSLQQTIVEHHKQEYLQLILKQKSEALNRGKQTSHICVDISPTAAEELFSLCQRSVCKPVKMKTEQAASMTDDDFLLAELNGHFQ